MTGCLSYAHTDEQYCHESDMTTDQYDSLSPTNRERVESRRRTTHVAGNPLQRPHPTKTPHSTSNSQPVLYTCTSRVYFANTPC